MNAGGLPEDMYYLALVESGFDPNAYSRAAAVGMWQFMTSTARDMGLRVDWWVDERRDPVKSTGAAVRFIKGIARTSSARCISRPRRTTAGPGRVARGLTRYADDLEGTPAATTSSSRSPRRTTCATRRASTCRSSSPRR